MREIVDSLRCQGARSSWEEGVLHYFRSEKKKILLMQKSWTGLNPRRFDHKRRRITINEHVVRIRRTIVPVCGCCGDDRVVVPRSSFEMLENMSRRALVQNVVELGACVILNTRGTSFQRQTSAL